jgi:hypothetical protein
MSPAAASSQMLRTMKMDEENAQQISWKEF